MTVDNRSAPAASFSEGFVDADGFRIRHMDVVDFLERHQAFVLSRPETVIHP